MYDLPEVRKATGALWRALAAHMRRHGVRNVPDDLSHDQPVRDLWSSPDLLFSQCCGFDVINRYKGRLRPIATPHFCAPGCHAENYCSVIVVAADCDFSDVRKMAGTIAVINGPESHSGMSALRHLVCSRHTGGSFFSEVKISGSHAASLDLVRHGRADVAAIDSVTLELLRCNRTGTMDGLKILGTTYSAPAPPYVVSAGLPEHEAVMIQNALLDTFNDPALAGCRARLLLKSLSLVRREDYWLHEAFKDYALKQGLPMVS